MVELLQGFLKNVENNRFMYESCRAIELYKTLQISSFQFQEVYKMHWQRRMVMEKGVNSKYEKWQTLLLSIVK